MFLTGEMLKRDVSGGLREKAPEVRAIELRSTEIMSHDEISV